MSIVCQTPEGWLLDHKQFIDNIYQHCRDLTAPHQGAASTADIQDNGLSPHGDPQTGTQAGSEGQVCSYVLNETLFDIHDQFRMDSCFDKRKQEEEENKEKTDAQDPAQMDKPKRRRRKRPAAEVNEGTMAANTYHMQVRDTILHATEGLRRLGTQSGYFKPANYKVSTNNREARGMARDLETGGPALAEWCKMAKGFTAGEDDVVHLDNTGAGDSRVPSLVNTLISHHHPTPCVRRLMGENYLFPPQAAFLMSDISNTAPLTADGRKYDLVVMDPPWYNKSVKRKKNYWEVCEDRLLDLPVLCAPGGLVVVWTTNRAAHHSFIKDVLLPHWGAAHLATWHWVKVTQTGEFVTDMDSPHGKRCYETLLLARVSADITSDVGDADVTSEQKEDMTSHHKVEVTSQQDVDVTSPLPAIPDQKVLVSVPCSLHSSKPPLHDVLRPYLPRNPRCLELFARSLLPGWTSWGNEVLKVQRISCYEKSHVS